MYRDVLRERSEIIARHVQAIPYRGSSRARYCARAAASARYTAADASERGVRRDIFGVIPCCNSFNHIVGISFCHVNATRASRGPNISSMLVSEIAVEGGGGPGCSPRTSEKFRNGADSELNDCIRPLMIQQVLIDLLLSWLSSNRPKHVLFNRKRSTNHVLEPARAI